MTRNDLLRAWGILLLVALLTRAIALGNPILHVDEQFYYQAARAWADGKLIYVDIYDRKPIGLFLIYLLPAHLPVMAGVWAYQSLALLSAWLTAVLASAVARRAGVPGTGIVAGILYLVWIIWAEGQGGQSPVFFGLLVASAAALVVESEDGPPITSARGLAAMLLFGLALQVKPSVVFEGAFFGLWVLWRRRRAGQSVAALLGLACSMVGLAVLPTLVAGASYAALGHFGDWWFATVYAISQRQPPPWHERLGNLGILVLILSPLVSMAVVALRRSPHLREPARTMLAGWLIAAIVGLLAFGTWFEHYGLPTMLPASIAAAALFAARGRALRWPMAALIVAAIGGQMVLLKKRWERGTPAQFERIVAAIGDGPGCLYVYAGDSMYYAAAHRCFATRYTFPAFLTRNTETIAIDQPGEIARIFAFRPAVVVDSGRFRGEIPERRAQLLSALASDYRVVAQEREGRNSVTVYRLNGAR